MNIRFAMGGGALAVALILVGQVVEHRALADRGSVAGSIGADVAVCTLPGASTYSRVGDIHAFSFGTNSVNLGDTNLQWVQNSSNHPVIAQNLYRFKNGRMEMIGVAWVKHGFCALQQSGCGSCAAQGGCLSYLKPGCADPYSSSLNGSQSGLGPRSDVNASTGEFPWTPTIAWGQTGNGIYKRLQVHDDEIDPALNPSAIYFIEGQYVHPQEGTSGRRHNNASYRRVNIQPSGNSYNLTGAFPTIQFLPAIYAWEAEDPEVEIQVVDVPGEPVDGRFHVAYRVYDNGDGTWRYEYAVHNLNSHRSAQSFSVPLPNSVNVVGTYYSDVKYHSGEIYTNEDWSLAISADSISWSGIPESVEPNANAIRWSTTFNFGFTADAPPVPGDVTIGLFRPGTPSSVSSPALVPDDVAVPTCHGDVHVDGVVNIFDLLAVLKAWGDCSKCPEDVNGDGVVNIFDLLEVLANWGPCE